LHNIRSGVEKCLLIKNIHPENPDGAFNGQPTAVSQTYVMAFAEC